MNNFIKQLLPYAGIILFFALLSIGYFAPAQFEGKVLFQDDGAAAAGFGSDADKYQAETGTKSWWTNSAFGGMPTYPFMGKGYYIFNRVEQVYRLGIDFLFKGETWLLFVMLLGFFILLKTLGLNHWLSVIGSMMWTFSSYFVIIIHAGHIWKFTTLAYIPPTIAGVILCYKQRYLLGLFVTAFFSALQLKSNHPQMSYYFLFVMIAMVVVYFIDALKEKKLPAFAKSTALVVIGGLLGLLVNLTNIYQSYQYSKYTMRGGSELTLTEEGKSAEVNEKGLDRDYITNWSYGIGETWSLLIPNVKGGKSGYIANEKENLSGVRQEFKQFVGQQNSYWGDQPFTSGPVYVGAFVMLLFVMGLFIVKSKLKWALLATTLLSIVLAWGKNLMFVTDLFIDYLPMYDKFRAVSSILVIAEFTIPLLAILALNEIIKQPKALFKEYRKALYIGVGATAGVSLLFAITPTLFFNFLSAQEAAYYLPEMAKNSQMAEAVAAIETIRQGMFTSDAWRSVSVILISLATMVLFSMGKIKQPVFLLLLGAITLIDLWSVDKRYLGYDDFHTAKNVAQTVEKKSPADEKILEDKSLSYRVFNTTVSPFNDNSTSRFHQSVGGYTAVKLQRYQDIIDHQLSKMNHSVYNMLNTKYFIQKGENGEPTAVLNPNALGNGWFVSNIQWVNSADEEMTELGKINPHETALVDKRFESFIANKTIAGKDSTASIALIENNPNRLVYKTESEKGGLALFSEVFYPKGWEATIDGKEVEIARANYILRALEIPAGKHEVVFTFNLESIGITEMLSVVASILILLLFLASCTLQFIKLKIKS